MKRRRGPPPPPLWSVILQLKQLASEAATEGGGAACEARGGPAGTRYCFTGCLVGRSVVCDAVPAAVADLLRSGCFGMPIGADSVKSATQRQVDGGRYRRSRNVDGFVLYSSRAGGGALASGTHYANGSAIADNEVRDLQYVLPDESWRFNLDDAFFLHHAVGCLNIDLLGAGDDVPMSCDASTSAEANVDPSAVGHTARVWRVFCRLQRTFVERYVTNCHYRSLGWFVRSGLQFGATYVMYREHPMASHSEFCALVVCEAADSLSPVPSWLQTQCHSRLSVQVNKKCAFVIVSRPSIEECVRAAEVEEALRRCSIEMITLGRFCPESLIKC